MKQNSTWQTRLSDGQLTYNLTDLDPGYSYKVNVVAVTAGTRSLPSEHLDASTLPVPPVNLTARTVGSSQITVTWTPQPSSYQDFFQVVYSLEDSSSLIPAPCVSSPCTVTPGPPAGQVVSFSVTSSSHNYTSLPATTTGSTAPGIPTDLAAQAGVRSLNITWSAPMSSVQAYYRLTLAVVGSNSVQEHNATADGPRLSYFSNSLLGGYLYKVEVRAMTLFAAGDAKTDLFITIPESVLNLRGQAVNTTSVRLTWENPLKSAIMFLNISAKLPDGAIVLTREENPRIQDSTLSDLVPGQQYYISVSVHSQYSSSQETAVFIRTKPLMPRVVRVVAGERHLTLAVTTDTETGVLDSIRVFLQGREDTQIPGKVGEVTFNNLQPGTEYTLASVSVSGNQSSEYVYTRANTKPRPPSNLTVSTASRQAVVHATWEGPASGSYDNFSVLIKDVDSVSAPQILLTKEKKVDIAGLRPGSTYNISVSCVKGDQTSDSIWALNTTTPLPATRLRLSFRGMDTVTVAWDAPTSSSFSGYALSFEPLNMTLVLVPANITQYPLGGLTPDSNYALKLYVYSSQPDGAPRYSQETSLNFSTYPESVAGLQKVLATPDTIMVNWTVPVKVRADYFQLGIRLLDPGSSPHEVALTLPASRTNATFNGLKPGRKYTIAIRTARNMSPLQPQQYGASVRLPVVTKPLAVENLRLTTINSSALLAAWDTNTTSLQSQFEVTYVGENVTRSVGVPASNMTSYQVNLTELLAGCEYAVAVLAIQATDTDTEDSLAVIKNGYTVPLPVTNLTLTYETSELSATWTPPVAGRWSGYQMRYRSVLHVNSSQFLARTLPPAMTSINVTGLFPGERYHLVLVVLSNQLESRAQEAAVTMKPLPPKDLHIVKNKTTATTATLSWVYDQSSTHTSKWRFHIQGAVNEKEVLATNQVNYSVELDSLVPGQTYNVGVTSVVDGSISQQQHLSVTTRPVINSRMEAVSSSNTSFTISFSNTVTSIYDYLSFTLLEAPGLQPVNRSNADHSHTVNFSGLEAGTKYTVQAVAVSRQEVSDPVILEMTTDPNPVAVNLSMSATSVTLDLGPQQGGAAQYTVTCAAAGNTTSLCGQQTATAGQQQVVFNDLTPFQLYKITVVTQTGVLRGERKQAVVEYEVKTNEGPPGPVQLLSATDEDLHTVTLSWQPPDVINGNLRAYSVSYQGLEPSDPKSGDNKTINDISTTSTQLKLDNLRAGFEYTFQVAGVTVVPGQLAEAKLTMKTAAPAFKPDLTAATSKPTVPGPSAAVVTDSMVSLVFINPFTNDNGFVRYHMVIVSRDSTADDRSPTVSSWAEAHNNSSVQVYQATERCDDFFLVDSLCGGRDSQRPDVAASGESRVFVIGAQTTAECLGQHYCNGPLAANTDYYVKLRGYTASGQFQETEYSDKIRTAETMTSNAAVVGGIAGAAAAVVIIIIVIVVFVMRRRHHPKAALHAGKVLGQSQNYMSSRPVNVADFSSHVLKMSADSGFKYAEEYEDLRDVGRGQLCLAAELACNQAKNRFTNILPYDHSRVKLLPIAEQEGSDYINANYMSGYTEPREYVATQGPLACTRDDFWRMVWELNSCNIIMLTRCQEKGKEKSDHYWPSDTEARFYGNVQVAVLYETHMPDWTLTEMNVSVGDESRTVRHFHYQVWPDFGVPRNPSTLIQCVRMVRENLVQAPGPIIVHCSAGVGRSGTFIVLDHVLQLIRERDEVDIFGIVHTLRQQRVLMVQTEQQYRFIHECLLCVLEGREDESIYANLGQINAGFKG
ncbi:hypothetical protein BsWGS_12611 [Bradybaena similaris]